jgi:hypothetical protein
MTAQRYLITGVSLGLIVSPAASGLYGLYFLGPLVAPIGMIGLVLSLFHGVAGYKLAVWLGLVEPAVVVEGFRHVYVELLNAVVWSTAYGTVGWITDCVRSRRARSGSV